MKIISLQSKLWWLAKADELRPQKGLVVMDAVKAVVDRFKFAAGPPGLPGPNDGYVFRQGGATLPTGDTVSISEFSFFNDGIALEIQSSTSDLLLTLEEFLSLLWRLGIRPPETPPNIVFQSMIVCEMNSDISRLIPDFDPIVKIINEATGASAPHGLKSIEYTVDPKVVPGLGSKVFRLDRRANEPYSANRWFSFANAKTEDHVKILSAIDRAAEEAAN